MQVAQSVSIVHTPRVDEVSFECQSINRQTVGLFTLRGQHASSFAKDLNQQCQAWQIDGAQSLHHHILDLLYFTRSKNLQLSFAISSKQQQQIVLATYAGTIIVQRNGLLKEISSAQEISLIVGNWHIHDQLILSTHLSDHLYSALRSLAQNQVSLEKMVSELSVIKQAEPQDASSVTLLTYQESEPIQQEIAHKQSWRERAIQLTHTLQQGYRVSVRMGKQIVRFIQKQNRKKLTTILAFGIGVGLLLMGVRSVRAHRQNQELAQLQTALASLTLDPEVIQAQAQQQPLAARQLVEQTLTQLEAMQGEYQSQASKEHLDQLITQLQTAANTIASENSLDQLQVSYNLGQFLGKALAVSTQGIFVLETNGKELLWIKPDQSQQTLQLPDQKPIRQFSLSENTIIVHSDGLFMLSLDNPTTWQQVKTEGESDQAAELMASFGPYTYLLNKEKRNIYRYYYNNDQLSEPIGWLTDKQGLTFATINDLFVDGDLWLSTEDGQLLKFSRGVASPFQIQGVSEVPSTPLLITSSAEVNKLFVLEKAKRRLLILTKEGQLISEINSNELAGVTAIANNQDGSVLYALSGSVIYTITPV